MEDLGVSIGLSYHDTNRKVRGGKLHVDTPKVKKSEQSKRCQREGFRLQVNFVLDIDRDRGVTTT